MVIVMIKNVVDNLRNSAALEQTDRFKYCLLLYLSFVPRRKVNVNFMVKVSKSNKEAVA